MVSEGRGVGSYKSNYSWFLNKYDTLLSYLFFYNILKITKEIFYMAYDFKKEQKKLYAPKTRPEIVEVPMMKFISVEGSGNPNEEDGFYKQAVGMLYTIAYTLKMSYKTEYEIEGFFEYVVPPLEGFWWTEDGKPFDYNSKEKFRWISVIRVPEFITEENLWWAIQYAKEKKKMDCSKIKLIEIEEKGYENNITDTRRHHEIYLSDPRRIPIEKLKTILRHPIKMKEE